MRPRLRTPKAILSLYPSEGKVYSINDFRDKYLHLLDNSEQEVIKSCGSLGTFKDIPDVVRKPLTRSAWLANKKTNSLKARRIGARGALLERENIYLKACRPERYGADFPDEFLPPGNEKLEYSRLEFGTLMAERAMREILGQCFFRRHGLPLHQIPLCIHEYTKRNHSLGFSFVFKTKGEQRVEKFIDYPNITISDLIAADVIRFHTGFRSVLTGEMNLKEINKTWYTEKKSDILIKMNIHGGFRGLLNSNIGNDVILSGDSEKELYICDFDSFRVIDIPKKLSSNFLRLFLLNCMIELIKTSLPITDYVNSSLKENELNVVKRVKEIYFSESSLWAAYKRKLDFEANCLGWDLNLMGKVLNAIQTTPAFVTVVLDSVINRLTLRRSKALSESMYTPHD